MRRRRNALLVAVGLTALCASFAGIIVARDVLVVRDGLQAARTEVSALALAASARDVPAVLGAASATDTALFPAEQRMATRRWRALMAVPRLGAPFVLVAELSTTLRLSLDVVAAVATDDVLAGLRPSIVGGAVDLGPLVSLAAALEAAPLEGLAASFARLEGADLTFSPVPVRDARLEAIELLAPALDTLGRARAVSAGLPTFLGADGPRKHLVVLQTSAELRGTGGLVGVLAVLEVDRGRLVLGEPLAFDPLGTGDAADGRSGAAVLQTLPAGERPVLDPDFLDRYGQADPNGSLSNVNLDPDVPTTGEVLLDLYEARTGVRLDGLILLDPFGLQVMLEALDAVLELPAELVAGTRAPRRLPAQDIARFILVDLYADFGHQQGGARDALTAALAGQALTALLSEPWDGVRMADAVVRASNGRHLQVHARDAVTSRAFAGLPVGGRFDDDLARPGVDAFAVTVNNVVGGKQDVHVSHATTIDVQLGEPGAAGPVRAVSGPDGATLRLRPVSREVTLRQTIVNPLEPGAFDLYVTGNCLVDTGEQGCFLGPEADHRAWLTFWLGADDAPYEVRDRDGFPPVRLGVFHGVTTIDRFLEVPSTETGWVEVASRGSADVELLPDGSMRYRFAWWRHAKGIGDELTVRIELGDAWRLVDATLVTEGRQLPRRGPTWETTPPTLTVRADGVSVEGVAGADVMVELLLRPRR